MTKKEQHLDVFGSRLEEAPGGAPELPRSAGAAAAEPRSGASAAALGHATGIWPLGRIGRSTKSGRASSQMQ